MAKLTILWQLKQLFYNEYWTSEPKKQCLEVAVKIQPSLVLIFYLYFFYFLYPGNLVRLNIIRVMDQTFLENYKQTVFRVDPLFESLKNWP